MNNQNAQTPEGKCLAKCQPTCDCLQDLGRKKKEEEEVVGTDFEPWSAKRGEILARFTTTEKLSIVSINRSSAEILQ